ncbi:MAG: hypothetical protein GWN58_64695, partial [Anaerolineae bacterium]|nr:hypothetical protein [Anaerolineae bacterium]
MGGHVPEAPELEHVRRVLEERTTGRPILDAALHAKGGATVLRDLNHLGLHMALTNRTITDVRRRGKFLIFVLSPGSLYLVINPKLAGSIVLCEAGVPRTKSVLFT